VNGKGEKQKNSVDSVVLLLLKMSSLNLQDTVLENNVTTCVLKYFQNKTTYQSC